MYKYILSCFLAIGSLSILHAQPGFAPASWQSNIESAEQLMAEGSYFTASKYYLKALEVKKDVETLYKVAEAYRLSRAYQNAAQYYAQVLEEGKELKSSYPLLQYYYGQTLMQNGDYNKAKDALTSFLEIYDGSKGKEFKKLAQNMVKGCEFAQTDQATVIKTERVQPLEGPVTSRYTELAPMPYGDDKILFSAISANEFVSMKDQDKYGRIYSAKISDFNQTSEKRTFSKSFNQSGAHVGNGAFSSDGNKLYHTVCEQVVEDNRVNCKIYISEKQGNSWTEPELLGDAFNSEGYSSSTPYVVKGTDGKDVVYYSSNRPGGFGGMDIWVANGNAAVNLGRTVNTVGMETTPFLDESGAKPQLYFSSNGHPGYGGQDIFRATKNNVNFSSWKDVVNVGPQLNGPADELYFIINPSNKKQGFFVSNREGTQSVSNKTCCDDIFATELKTDVFATIAGVIYDENNKATTNTKVTLYDVTDGKRTLVGTVTTTDDGKYSFENLPAGREYKLEVMKDKYQPQNYSFSTVGLEEDKEIKKDFYLKLVPPPPPPPPPPVPTNQLTLCGTTYSDKGAQGKSKIDNVKVDIYQIDPITGKQTLYTTVYSANGGEYCTKIPVGYKYRVVGSEPNHLTTSEDLDLSNYRPTGNEVLRRDLDLVLQYKQIGLAFTIENIYYDFDSARLRSESITSLQKILRILNNNPSIIVEMGSHTDSKGSNSYNQRLSQKRAQSVVDWLTRNGIPKSRLTARGYGEESPVAPNTKPDGSDNPEGRQLNRRTEFRVIGEVPGLIGN